MVHENNPAITAIKDAKANGNLKEHVSKPEEANPAYWRLFYEIQGSMVESDCTNIQSKAHSLAKKLYDKWMER